MEQKKILWVVAAVSVFVLVIFGFALVIYSPSKTAEAEQETASVIVPGRASESARLASVQASSPAVDPDSWARRPESMPGLDTEIVPSSSAESLTALNLAYPENPAQEQEAESADAIAEETINVRDLASRIPQEERPAGRQAVVSSDAAESQSEAAPSGSGRRRATGVISVNQPRSTATAQDTKPAQDPKPAPARAADERARAGREEREKQTVVEYWIQTGSFTTKLNAENARKMLTDRFFNAEIFTRDINGSLTYRVRVGPYKDRVEADYWLGTISETPEFSGSYVSRVTAER